MNDLFQLGAVPAILLAAGLTYGLRLGGLLLADRLPKSGPARRFLDYLPGTILLSLTVPGALHAGIEGIIGLGACLLVFLRTRNMLLTMAAGMAGVCLLRFFTGA
ncbi:MAG: AzlD domain-containing protein [Deltaproteobacteria bacterium]|nr:AzlD domain-containing protein [Deltaproteobacteria bacterium]